MKVINKFDRVIKIPLEGAGISGKDCEKVWPRMNSRIESVLITRALLKMRIQELAKDISRYYRGQKRIEAVFILEGARVFASDLEREIYNLGGPEVRCQSIKARTYGVEIKKEKESQRPVKIFHTPWGLAGKKVLLLEDIVDQGFTLGVVRDWLQKEAGVKEIKICALLDKRLKAPSDPVKRLRKSLKLDWVGFAIPDRWVAGYGIDAGEDFRFLPFIVTVREQYYKKGGRK